MLTAGIVIAALLALLALAPLASAASDPVGTNSTATVTLNKGFVKGLKKKGVKTSAVNPAKLKGSKLTLKVTGGTIDPTTGKGSVTLGGGLKFKAGKKAATVKKLVLTNTKTTVLGAKLTGNVGGKNVVFATVVGFKSARNGFGVNLTIKQLKLSGAAANQLNKKLGLKGKAKAFKGNKVMGSAKSEVQLATLAVLPGGKTSLTTDLGSALKLNEVEVTLSVIAPATQTAPLPPAFDFPVIGGTLAPNASAGIAQTNGGLLLTQAFGGGNETKMTLGNFNLDFGTKTASVEVTVESNVEFNPVGEPGVKQANLGAIGRSSIADLDLSGAAITSDPATHKVTVTGAKATLQALTAEVLNSVFGKPKGKAPFKAGDPLGTVSFEAITE